MEEIELYDKYWTRWVRAIDRLVENAVAKRERRRLRNLGNLRGFHNVLEEAAVEAVQHES